MQPRVAVFIHEKNEPPGVLEEVFSDMDIPFEGIPLFRLGRVPDTGHFTHLVFMGGPMSVNDEETYPWLAEEKALIRRAGVEGRPVLGICLGAQLIAAAHGARVYPSVPETGWSEVLCRGTGIFAGFPDRLRVFQLHGETFDIPPGGQLECTGETVRNQAFSLGSAVAIQFHLELTGNIISDWSAALGPVARAGIENDTPSRLPESNRLCRVLGERFIQGWDRGA